MKLTARYSPYLLTFGLAACGAQKAEMAPAAPATEGVAYDAPAAYPQPMAAAEAEPSPAEEAAAPAPAAGSVARKADGLAMAERAEKPKAAIAAESGVRAGEWDDNANYRDFLRYEKNAETANAAGLDVSVRRFVVVSDKNGKGVPNCRVSVSDSAQHTAELVTTASGRAILFPRAEGLSGKKLLATAHCGNHTARTTHQISGNDGLIALSIGETRSLPQKKTIDVAFVLDTTGSMSEEISAVKATLRKVAATLDNGNVNVRVGLVEYKDKSDQFLTRVYPMTSNIREFEKKVAHIDAGGGGDMPEDMNSGLSKALTGLSWSKSSVARLVFVIADAPPHLDYGTRYTDSMLRASKNGIKLFTVAASGMNDIGQLVFRQLAQYTGGTNMFVLRGGAGPQSTGAGDAKSGCGGTHENYQSGNLDQLITHKIRLELASLQADPTRIAGLEKDENAKPCSERLVLAE
jgi:Mg-chelatase subunit ChlD